MRIYQLALVLLHSCVGISASEKGSTDVSLRDQEQKPSRDLRHL